MPARRRCRCGRRPATRHGPGRSEEHTSELQSQSNLVCRLLLEKKNEIATYFFAHRCPQLLGQNRGGHLLQRHSLDASDSDTQLPQLVHSMLTVAPQHIKPSVVM